MTPVYKEGAPPLAGVFAISHDGSSLLGASFGVFGGGVEDELGNSNLIGAAYVYSRTESGWRAFAIGPSPARYNSNGMYDASTELDRSLWELGTSSQPKDATSLYIEPSPGSFIEVGPATPGTTPINRNKYDYLGGSHDLSRVLFSTHPGFSWPFDETAEAASPLYEYVGVGNAEPRLVGVRGGARSTALVSKCGTRLGSSDPRNGDGSMYNAISADGTRVFFTAVGEDDQKCLGGGPSVEPPVDELSAREELPTGELNTTPISEPSSVDCEACLTSALKDAVFEGASEDGSKVFFMTERELLPGATGENLYEYDFGGPAGHKITLVSAAAANPEVLGVARVSEDGSHVYFVARGKLTSLVNSAGYAAAEGRDNLYVFAGGHTSFIATLSEEDRADWRQADERPVAASPEGRFLVFTSREDLTREGVTPGNAQVFQYDAQMGILARASIGRDGYNNDGKAPEYDARIRTIPPSGYSYSLHDSPTSANGVIAPEDGAVFFQSPSALTPQALNNQVDELGVPEPNVYEYRNGSVYLISDGQDVGTIELEPSVQLVGWSSSGADLFFSTADSLIAQDTDTQLDVYDARTAGGFRALAGLSGCTEGTCHGVLTPAPWLPVTLAVPTAEAPQAVGGRVKAKTKTKAKPRHKVKRRRRAKKARKAARGKHHQRKAGRS